LAVSVDATKQVAARLRHWWLARRPPPDEDGLVRDLDGCTWDSQMASSDQPQELTYVDMDTFLATF
jgi:hypothetical protein